MQPRDLQVHVQSEHEQRACHQVSLEWGKSSLSEACWCVNLESPSAPEGLNTSYHTHKLQTQNLVWDTMPSPASAETGRCHGTTQANPASGPGSQSPYRVWTQPSPRTGSWLGQLGLPASGAWLLRGVRQSMAAEHSLPVCRLSWGENAWPLPRTAASGGLH